MDFDDFDDDPQNFTQTFENSIDVAAETLRAFDAGWYTSRVRASRRMDLLGDYAGNEFFLIDGESLFQTVLDDPLLAIGREMDCSFQILHAYHTLERILSEFTTRSANFEIVFFHENRHLTLRTGDDAFIVASRMLARTLLFKHLLKLNLPVHIFETLVDPRWKEYESDKKPMFIMINDGNVANALFPFSSTRVLGQRRFLYDLLRGNIAVAILKGTSYADSKILTFVYEPERLGSHGVFPPRFVRRLILAQETLETSLSEQTWSVEHALSAVVDKDASATSEQNFIRELSKALISRANSQEVFTTLAFVNIVHYYHLPFLSVRERSQPLIELPSTVSQTLCKDFLTPLFALSTQLLSSKYASLPYDFDGRIFLLTAVYLTQNSSSGAQEVVGPQLSAQAVRLWEALKQPLSLRKLSKWLQSPSLPGPSTPPSSNTLQLLPFDNPVLNPHLPLVPRGSSTSFDENPSTTAKRSYLHFGKGTMFSDTRHWHNQKSILPAHMGGAPEKPMDQKAALRRLRKNQYFMFNLQMQAATITGASGSVLRQLIIPSVGPRGGAGRVKAALAVVDKKAPVIQAKQGKQGKKNEKPVKLSSKQLLLQKIQDQKLSDANESSRSWWKEKLKALEAMPLDAQVQELSNLLRNKRAEEELLRLEMRCYHLHLELQRWIQDDTPSAPEVKDKYSLSIMRSIKQMVDKKVLTPTTQEVITTILTVFGFQQYLEGMLKGVRILEGSTPSFKFRKLVKSKTGAPLYGFMVIEEDPIQWQLRLFGEYMDRSMDSAPDSRVPFEPDAWQRKVLDCVDANDSILVVAPTSAGKTFISFYAMEQVLRSSDDDILVYVAPTKALVTQIAAEIYARFSKKMDGKTCWAIHTRDHRVNDPQKCQILVTVPEVLAIMLLSPPLATVWTPRIKRIVLDEIHSIGQQEGGAVWEQILLLAPCPIIGLSATIGSPEIFNNWLESVQTSHGFKHAFIQHPHRYSHLRKFFYVINEEVNEFSSLSQHKDTARTRFIHPIGALSFGRTTIPDDLALESGDTLSLYHALVSVEAKSGLDLKPLDPTVFFAGRKEMLKQKDILEYEAQLKSAVATLLDRNDRRDPAGNVGLDVVARVQDPVLSKLGSKLDVAPTMEAFTDNLIQLLADLHVQNLLPAILFNFDRAGCEIIANGLAECLEKAENKYKKTSPAWKRKLTQWEAWKANAKERERERERAEKQKKRKLTNAEEGGAVEDATSTSHWTWEQSFDPDQPLPDFSFIDYKSPYTLSELEQDIKKLSWGGRVPEWAFALLRRGIGLHHAGMNKGYRSLIEALFRRGFLRVVIATGTLALGINAPAKTSVFCADSPFLTALMYRQCAGRAGRRGYDLLGNVIFYGLPMDRVQRLILSKLPLLGGGFPVTSTLVLRLCNLLEESNRAPNVVKAISALMSLPRVSFSSDVGHDYLVHHIQFSIEYLRRNGLLNEEGKPMNLFAIAGHLYYTEPSNLALVGLLRSGVLHAICKGISAGTNESDVKMEEAKRTYILLMAHLFGRRELPSALSENQEKIKELSTKYPSTIVLPRLPEHAFKSLESLAKDILEVFIGYAKAYAASRAQMDKEVSPVPRLPLSGTWSTKQTSHSSAFTKYLRTTSIPTNIRSPFVANSGLHDDDFRTVQDLAETVRTDIHLNPHAIPSLDDIIATSNTPPPPREGLRKKKKAQKQAVNRLEAPTPKLNAYLYDFYVHGQSKTLVHANGIRRGDLWYLIEEFRLTLLTIKAALEQLLVRASVSASVAAAASKASKKMPSKRVVKKKKKGEFAAWDNSSDDDDSDSDVTDAGLFSAEGSTIVAVESREETLLNLDINALDTSEVDDDEDNVNMDFKRPSGVTGQDWMVYRVVSLACAEFDTKAKAMWA